MSSRSSNGNPSINYIKLSAAGFSLPEIYGSVVLLSEGRKLEAVKMGGEDEIHKHLSVV